jgi:hypothetical protein
MRSLALVLLIACACTSPSSAGPAADRDQAFDDAVAAISTTRTALARRFAAARGAKAKAAIRAEARAALLATIDDELVPAWLGTPWGLGGNSTATRPHEPDMTVGCSYFVTSMLGNVGVVLSSRYKFAQAAALHIQRSLAPGRDAIHRYYSIPADALERAIRSLGDGLYLIGLNNHVGFVLVGDGQVRFIHASYTNGVVSDEPLATAAAIANSRSAGYFVSPVFAPGNDWLIDRWLRGETVPFVGS